MKNSTYQKLFRATLATTVATGAFVAAVPTFAQADVAKDITFKDVKNTHQFYEAIKSLTSRGVINGYTDGTYKPSQEITRAQAAKIMALALDLDTKNVVDPGFKDVKKDNPFYGHIAALVNAGVISGYEDKTFKPTGNLTRAQVAKMIVLGYKLEEEKLSNLPFKDVNEKIWYASYIQTVFSNKITSGTTATTFSPDAIVTRGQVASFIFKSELATEKKGSEVISITGDKVVLSDGTFTLDASLKAIFSAANLDFLKGAIVKYTAKDGVIVGVSSIEIKASGTAEKNLVIDGQGLVFPGNLTINGDYIHLKNLTIKGAFEIGKDVKNSFTAEKVIVEGTAKVSNKAASTATAQSGVSYSAAATAPTPTIIFIDATFANVEVTKDGAIIEYKGSSKVKELILSSNVILKAAEGITIPKVTIKAGATKVTLDANVGNLTVNSAGNLTLAGTGNIQEVTIESNKDVKFETKGKIEKLSIKSKDTHISLGTTKVGDLVLPAGTTAKDIVADFEESKGNIENVSGVTNPEVTPPAAGGGGGTGGGGVVTGEQLLNQLLLDQLGAGNASGDVAISLSGNAFTVIIKKESSTLGHFRVAAQPVFDTIKSNTVVKSAVVSFTAGNEEIIISNSNVDNNQDLGEVIAKALAKVNLPETTQLSVLKGKSIKFQVTGTIDNKAFNTTYTFNFVGQ
ncbi:S-layer homology domain-containing protein [Sporosarcina sp. BP05]|uniref:S-layer homology domain-containing protein n=1 Tax=Sporosarcina sp. BP05 TaxID=2758726 RepID=UPI0016478C21|nr:S-layer homology domain-containing protein [Sporosarcina sp. BP05]